MSYHIPSQQVTQSGQLLLNLQVEVLLLNGSHLHLVSPIMNISAPNCAGEQVNCCPLIVVIRFHCSQNSVVYPLLIIFLSH